MYFGVDYYPEHWPEERWPVDAKMMKAANMNIVRLAEFGWAKMEPREGTYDFSWLDGAIEVLAREGIGIILGTPTAAAPKWLMDAHPDFYPVDMYGMTKGFGTRRHYCYNNKLYGEYSRRIAEMMARHYKDNPNIVAWQIDNELGGQCFCENCRKAFHGWLENKYGCIDKLNEEWGTVFWSHTYGSWDEIPLPRYSSSDGFSQNPEFGSILSTPYNHNPGLLLDFHRFSSDSVVEYQKLQIEEIRKESSLPITHNYMGHYSEIDYFDLGKDLDFISWDNYPDNMWAKASYQNISMGHDLMRGIKNGNFWMMEQQSGPCGWHTMGDTPEPGQLRLWTYQALAHGAETVVYFRWRACTFGIEQYWYGILDHDGIGRRRYDEIKEIGEELAAYSDLFVGSEIKCEVALIKSYDNFWSHRGQPHNSKFNYNSLLYSYYGAFHANNINMDVTSVDVDFENYKIVVMPAFNLMNEELGDKCRGYVENGGILLITFRSGIKTWNNRMTTMTSPGYFKEIAGIELEEFDSINSGRSVKVKGTFGEGTASIWCDVIKSNGAEALAAYDSHYYSGKAAVTVNNYGKGKVYYAGCDLDDKAMERLAGHIVKTEGITPALADGIPGVEAVRKQKDGKIYRVVLNHNNKPVEIPVNANSIDILGNGAVNGTLFLKPYGVAILAPEPVGFD